MIPLRDDNQSSSRPVVTIGIVAACVLIYATQATGKGAIDAVTAGLAMLPARLSGDLQVSSAFIFHEEQSGLASAPAAWVPDWLTMLTCTFLHADILHLLGNVWFLWVFGDNVEDRFGKVRFLCFYLACGFLASLAEYVSDPHSWRLCVGASGAIAGVMGAYLRLFPSARILTLLMLGIWIKVFEAPAWGLLVFWFACQVISALMTVGSGAVAGVAWWAHIGGFFAGFAFAAWFEKREGMPERPRVAVAHRGRSPRR